MKNTKKNHQGNQIERSPRNAFRILPMVAAMAASGIIQPAFAVESYLAVWRDGRLGTQYELVACQRAGRQR